MLRSSRPPILAAIFLALSATLSACSLDGGRAEGDRPEKPTPVVSLPAGVRTGPRSDSCVSGWVVPRPRTSLFRKPLRIMGEAMGVMGEFVVVDMRYFEGPESPRADKGYQKRVRRWYVKAYLARDRSFRGRWIVEEREFGPGLVAVAPFQSRGFVSPDWVGFQHESTDQERRAYPGLPGTWGGTPYDFVNGGAGVEIPGLPPSSAGCLEGT